jgi:hypothetical protein
MFEWQACSHSILMAPIYRINSTIDLENVVLVRETAVRRDASFHGNTPSITSETLCRLGRGTLCTRQAFPDAQDSNLDFVLNRSDLAQPHRI